MFCSLPPARAPCPAKRLSARRQAKNACDPSNHSKPGQMNLDPTMPTEMIGALGFPSALSTSLSSATLVVSALLLAGVLKNGRVRKVLAPAAHAQ